MTQRVRGLGARIGIAALNLLGPGLGLLRLGDLRAGLLFLSAVPVVLAVQLLLYALSPELPFAILAGSIAVAALVGFGALAGSGWLSFRRSRIPQEHYPHFARWYGILGAIVGLFVAENLLVDAIHRVYKPFYIPSEAMEPTFLPGDRLVGVMRAGRLARGDVILLRMPGSVYVKRLAALPGDRIALRRGVVVLNDAEVPQILAGQDVVTGLHGPTAARRLRERFPGEPREHFIYDTGASFTDDFPEVTVPAGHLFVLGDNRDSSADSRVPREQGGVALLPVADVVGHALYYTYGPSRKAGQRVH